MLRKKSEAKAKRQIKVPQGLKPSFVLLAFCGTTKVVPCYKAPPRKFFRSLFSPGLPMSVKEMPAPKGEFLRRSLQGHKCPCSFRSKSPRKKSCFNCQRREI